MKYFTNVCSKTYISNLYDSNVEVNLRIPVIYTIYTILVLGCLIYTETQFFTEKYRTIFLYVTYSYYYNMLTN